MKWFLLITWLSYQGGDGQWYVDSDAHMVPDRASCVNLARVQSGMVDRNPFARQGAFCVDIESKQVITK
jgi:hypothetical protein